MFKISDFKKILFVFILFSLACTKTENPVTPKVKDPDPVDEKQVDIPEIDKLVTDLMTKYNLPGASLAVSKDEKLVYSKGLGFADLGTKEEVTPNHIFRIASCTKPYTGMAIMKLVEEGKLKLSDKVFGDGALMGTKYGTKTYSEETKNITVSHLLHNTSGAFVNTQKRDLINWNDALSQKEFISWALDNMINEFSPGSSYHYVNVNFFIASMLVEEVSGMSFSDYLKQKVWTPVNDTETTIGVNKTQLPNEVKYYGQGVLEGREYDFSLERYYGAGAIVSNARSLLKFVTAIDGKSAKPDLLSQSLLTEYTTTSEHSSSAGHGIAVWGNRLYFYGALPGTRSGWILDKSTGLAAAIVFNGNIDYTNGDLNQTFGLEMQDVLVDLVSKNRAYKNIDQF